MFWWFTFAFIASTFSYIDAASLSLSTTTASWTLHVLAQDRPEPLERLLQSLLEADYLGKTVDLSIHVDGLPGVYTESPVVLSARHEKRDIVLSIARNATAHWPYGRARVNDVRTQLGLRKSWLAAYTPLNNTDFAVILEDDCEVSSHFFRFAHTAMSAVVRSNNDDDDGKGDIAGVSMQRSHLNAHDGMTPFKVADLLYVASDRVGTWGFAPVPSIWAEFQQWYNSATADVLTPDVEGIALTGWYNEAKRNGREYSIWSLHFLKFLEVTQKRGVLHAHLPELHTFVASWRADGEHFTNVNRKDAILLEAWNPEIDEKLTSLRALPTVDERRLPDLLDQRRQLHYQRRLPANQELEVEESYSEAVQRRRTKLVFDVDQIHTYEHAEVISLLTDRHVILMGDSVNMRMTLELIHWMDTGEPYFDKGGRWANYVDFLAKYDHYIWLPESLTSRGGTNAMQWTSFYHLFTETNTLIEAYFMVEAWNHVIAEQVTKIVDEVKPDALIVNSGLWDAETYGAKGCIDKKCKPHKQQLCEHTYRSGVEHMMAKLAQMNKQGGLGIWRSVLYCVETPRCNGIADMNSVAYGLSKRLGVHYLDFYPYITVPNFEYSLRDKLHPTAPVNSVMHMHLLTMLDVLWGGGGWESGGADKEKECDSIVDAAPPQQAAEGPPPPATGAPLPAIEPPAAVVEPPPPAAIEEDPPTAAIEEPPAAIEEPPAAIEEPPAAAIEEEQPAAAIEEEEPAAAIEEEPPAAAIEPSTAVIEEPPAAIEEPPAAIEEPPAAIKPHHAMIQPPSIPTDVVNLADVTFGYGESQTREVFTGQPETFHYFSNDDAELLPGQMVVMLLGANIVAGVVLVVMAVPGEKTESLTSLLWSCVVICVVLGVAAFGEMCGPAGFRPAAITYDSASNDDVLVAVVVGTILLSVVTRRELPEKDRFAMNRAQTNELKGWMQLAFVMYHYGNTDDFYQCIRGMVSCYVWLTGFGNGLYFWGGDSTTRFTLARFMQSVWRINVFGALLSLATGTDWILYYVIMLHTLHFALIFFCLQLAGWIHGNCRGEGGGEASLGTKLTGIGLMLAVTVLIWEVPGVYEATLKPLLHGMFGSFFEQYFWFRTSMDCYSSICGLCGAMVYKQLVSDDGWPLNLSRPAFVMQMLVGVCTAAVWVAVWVTHPLKEDYQSVHAYVGCMWIPLYIMLRNSHEKLVAHVCPLLEFFGVHSLELYLLQYHLFLTRKAERILYLIPTERFALSNMVLCGVVWMLCAHFSFSHTSRIYGYLKKGLEGYTVRTISVGGVLCVGYTAFALIWFRRLDPLSVDAWMLWGGMLVAPFLALMFLVKKNAAEGGGDVKYTAVALNDEL